MNTNRKLKPLQITLFFVILTSIVFFANGWLFSSLDPMIYLFIFSAQMIIFFSILSALICAFYYESKLAKQLKKTKDIIKSFEDHLEFNRASSEEGRQILEKMQQELALLAEKLGNKDKDNVNKLPN